MDLTEHVDIIESAAGVVRQFHLWPLLALPLLGALLTYFIGSYIRKASGWIATAASAFSFLWVLEIVRNRELGEVLENNLFLWFSVGDLSLDFALRFDGLTQVMCLVITGIGTLIHLYSIGYMSEEPDTPRFFSYLNLFMFSMLTLVLGGNLLVLFVGWEGVGLCSYLLIGFWFRNSSYASAGRKAFVVNRIGDLGFLLAVFLLLREFGTVDFIELKESFMSASSINSFAGMSFGFFAALVCGALFVGATGKSAQIPLYVWLPDAMAGPTPVSALIHAATMVTAGIYLMSRAAFLFDAAPMIGALVVIIAVATSLLAAAIAFTQNDIKKVLAYSTVSQLGFMFIAAGVGAYWVAVFHLVTHAFFKACLFLTAGSVIHGCHHEQDMREMGGLWSKMPITTLTYAISTLAIAGIFPFAGYQSKHAILDALAKSGNGYLSPIVEGLVIVVSCAAFMTAFYMTRSFILTFLGRYRGHAHPHESPLLMTIPLLILASLSAIGGLALVGAFGESYSLAHVLSGAVAVPGHMHGEGLLSGLAHSWVGFLGIGVAAVFYLVVPSLPKLSMRLFGPLSQLSLNKFLIDELYAFILLKPLKRLSVRLWKVVDQSIIDGLVNGTGLIADVSGEVLRGTHSGYIKSYAFWMTFGAIVLLFVCF